MDTAYRVSPLRSGDPDQLGEYKLVGLLGRGGMGVVYLGRGADGRFVAIKLIHADLAADPEFSGRFRSEVERARTVPSFCTAEFLGADLEHEPPYLVVEYVDGPSLSEVVDDNGPLSGGALHSLAVGIATALTGIHGAGVIHRDLKPDNVLLAPGSPKVIDFGIARPFEVTSRHTRTDVMVGTVAYMAPERFSAEPNAPVTAAADIFAWGCVVGYAGTGLTPFHSDSPPATAARILTQPPHLEGLPESLRGPVLLALAKDPADRPTAPELLAMLLGESPVPAPIIRTPEVPAQEPPAPIRHRRGRMLQAALAGLLLIALGTIAGLVIADRGEPQAIPTLAPAGLPSAASAASSKTPSAEPRTKRTEESAPLPGVARPTVPQVLAPKPTKPKASASVSAPASVKASANPSGRNLALGKEASSSSVEDNRWLASEAVDGDPESRWSSAWSDPQWLRVDLGARWQVSQIVVRWENSHAIKYRIQLSTDAKTWKTVYSTTSSQGGTVTVTPAKVPARYIRVYGTERSTQYGYSIYELEVR